MTGRPSGRCAAPDLLTGDEGETVCVRRDLARTPTLAAAYALEHDGRNVHGMEVAEVEMMPVLYPASPPTMWDWWPVRTGTPDAVGYWRFRL